CRYGLRKRRIHDARTSDGLGRKGGDVPGDGDRFQGNLWTQTHALWNTPITPRSINYASVLSRFFRTHWRYLGMYVVSKFFLIAITAISLAAVAIGCSSSKKAATETTDDKQVEVGYGTQSESDISGSVATVDAEEALKERPAGTLEELLKGRVSGVRVTREGGGLAIRIRGRTSISGGNDPLYVLDDVPIVPDPGGVISFLNPHDIESITVLKDASSTAIYGARGANGVILIKTKR
ncbi:MAG: TonB-dependent receptor plug domain-containing protein, partial [Rhodothermales bacterium]|nr:TonB-dependent receptor plug domain-containing protein [Rhodothermales bacterium]